MSGLKIRFDVDFDEGAWPGPLGQRDASAGELWVGPMGLLGRLEIALGLGGAWASAVERAAALIPSLLSTDGYWAESASADALATARRLLSDRDFLWMCGWQGEPVSKRLKALAEVTQAASPGVPDRLTDIASALETRDADLEQLELVGPEGELPPLWRAVLGRLKERGTVVAPVGFKPARANGDLAGARRQRFTPKADGGLQLLRPYGPMQAADLVAAWLAQGDLTGRTVIIGADALLDSALFSHGLPTVGAGGSTPVDARLQVLPCVLELAWDPPDPNAAWRLLSLPARPVPGRIAGKLLDALAKWPSMQSEDWKRALAEGLAEIEDGARQKRIEERLSGLLYPRIPRTDNRYPVDELRRRVDIVARWARGYLKDHDEDTGWSRVVVQCQALSRIVDLAAVPTLSPSLLGQLVEAATTNAGGGSLHPAQAGLRAVGAPGCLAGPADTVVWWNFTRESVPSPRPSPLQPTERDALQKVGVRAPALGTVAENRAARWWRPLMQAEQTLLLVCPRHDSAGAESHPHPLWDEIEAKIPKQRRAELRARLVVSVPIRLRMHAQPLAALPNPTRDWQTTLGPVSARRRESPSGLQKLLGCPLAWTLQYVGYIQAATVPLAQPGPLLSGRLIHHVLELVLPNATLTPNRASSAAGEAFDRVGPELAGQLFVPGAEKERDEIRQIVCKSAEALVSVLRDAGLSIAAMEKECERKLLGTTFGGFADMVLGPKPAIIDLKWGNKTGRQKEVAKGGALQLAAYSRLVSGRGGADVPVAYFILTSQELVTRDPQCFGGAAVRIDGPSPKETWAAAEAAYALRRAELDEGLVVAPVHEDEHGLAPPEEAALADGVLEIPPPCQYCDFGALCGRSFAEVQ